jgi:uncharacterized protein (DUF1330 family)
MAAFGLAHLREVKLGPAIAEYLKRIDATLVDFGGRFIVHGGVLDVLEGSWPGSLVIIEFPDMNAARSWYASEAYQAIKHLRADNSSGDLILAGGVPDGHKSIDLLGPLGFE